MAGPKGGKYHDPEQGGVVELAESALGRTEPLMEALGNTPTAERLAAVLGQPGTGVTGTTATVTAPGETATDITAMGTQGGIPPVDEQTRTD